MSVAPDLAENALLEVQIQAALDRWLQPCFTKPYEHITASANSLGELRLSGLVTDAHIVDEAVRLTKQLPGVRTVSSFVIVTHAGGSIRL
jgi:BON domain